MYRVRRLLSGRSWLGLDKVCIWDLQIIRLVEYPVALGRSQSWRYGRGIACLEISIDVVNRTHPDYPLD
jgi:hypothetical protein